MKKKLAKTWMQGTLRHQIGNSTNVQNQNKNYVKNTLKETGLETQH